MKIPLTNGPAHYPSQKDMYVCVCGGGGSMSQLLMLSPNNSKIPYVRSFAENFL